ncbi:DUF808 domain-containing protein [Thiofilum flexile]|uniref:DUF808 domain-containing protein n=1 Tax=Thiofilum flexile TaxID=125627 RepID=UPI000362F9DA|nr:DUF808 domain-containing protein [Thiofilum flexile]
MAGASLLTLLDDIATILDDVALMTKVAAKKTAGVLGDDLALNAQQVSGVSADRELPVVWSVALGSLLNKAILVPAALLISYFIPQAITPLLMIGGLYLCYEGVEKLFHSLKDDEVEHSEHLHALVDTKVDMVAFEKDKIKGAIRTDFILSAEIIVIALGTVATMPLTTQILVLTLIALAMTVGVYGLVAGIVKLDDLGLYLNRLTGQSIFTKGLRVLGRGLINAAPYLMKILTIVGTAAMFMVGGSILMHGLGELVPVVHHTLKHINDLAANVPGIGSFLAIVTPTLLDTIGGIVAGAITLLVVTLVAKVLGKSTEQHA